ncbi:MAG: hypothetical protein B193_3375 [Solidesulfovibrio magneticus str. Maddingley MBC34]|uniref:Winged helix-turn-helix domain-containing protein n=1 Tax=Solidesulfovibrio magneticus str. Maddingley MBC34 TaxID=1206767 RepID=K6FH55_9BACT|nr:MAG: hypothetical protein B193_3375 [Solidesulfovibrio magneticus str. Maddingley MBC34]
MPPEMQNPGDGRGFAGKGVVCDDKPILPSPADLCNDNSASAQRSRLLAALIKGPVSTLDARKFHDILHPAARVQELRNRGHLIDTVWTDDFTSEGNPHRVALYLYRGTKEAR